MIDLLNNQFVNELYKSIQNSNNVFKFINNNTIIKISNDTILNILFNENFNKIILETNVNKKNLEKSVIINGVKYEIITITNKNECSDIELLNLEFDLINNCQNINIDSKKINILPKILNDKPYIIFDIFKLLCLSMEIDKNLEELLTGEYILTLLKSNINNENKNIVIEKIITVVNYIINYNLEKKCIELIKTNYYNIYEIIFGYKINKELFNLVVVNKLIDMFVYFYFSLKNKNIFIEIFDRNNFNIKMHHINRIRKAKKDMIFLNNSIKIYKFDSFKEHYIKNNCYMIEILYLNNISLNLKIGYLINNIYYFGIENIIWILNIFSIRNDVLINIEKINKIMDNIIIKNFIELKKHDFYKYKENIIDYQNMLCIFYELIYTNIEIEENNELVYEIIYNELINNLNKNICRIK